MKMVIPRYNSIVIRGINGCERYIKESCFITLLESLYDNPCSGCHSLNLFFIASQAKPWVGGSAHALNP